jgi:hypothetical protein
LAKLLVDTHLASLLDSDTLAATVWLQELRDLALRKDALWEQRTQLAMALFNLQSHLMTSISPQSELKKR